MGEVGGGWGRFGEVGRFWGGAEVKEVAGFLYAPLVFAVGIAFWGMDNPPSEVPASRL